MSPNASNKTRLLRIDAAAAADAHTRSESGSPTVTKGLRLGVSLLIRTGCPPESARSPWSARLLAVGSSAWVAGLPEAAGAEVVGRPGSLLIPGLVNAHTHLDLTHIGPQPFDESAGFGGWIARIRAGRRSDAAGIAESVRAGVALLRRGGTVAVGDIAGPVGGRASLLAARALRDTAMAGVSFIEFFALGAGESRGVDAARACMNLAIAEPVSIPGWRVGISPHATYSAGAAAYRLAAEFAAQGVPACSHVGESPEERELVTHSRGPIRDMLSAIGIWDDHAAAEFDGARSPVQVALRRLTPSHTPSSPAGRTSGPVGRTSCPVGRTSCPPVAPFTLIHVNDCSDTDRADLASACASVIYCPRASAYFHAHHHFGPHRYRELLAAGVRVALGTDSIVNLPAGSDDPRSGRISVLDEMRFLYQRDGADPRTLLAMATTNAAAVLGLDEAPFTLLPHATDQPWRGNRPVAGVVCVPACPTAEAALHGDAAPELVVAG